MARRGEILQSPINGQRVVFRETSRETGGELLRLDFFVAAGGSLADENTIRARRRASGFSLGTFAAV